VRPARQPRTRRRAGGLAGRTGARGAARAVDDYQLDQSADAKGPPGEWTADEARASFAASYPRILAQFNGQYRRMFAELLAGHAPLAFNCSAGKDRTGIGAALLLTALGVPRETVIADYLLSNQTLNPAALMAGKASAAGPLGAYAARGGQGVHGR
jgi:protein-tyrosine phosphatase